MNDLIETLDLRYEGGIDRFTPEPPTSTSIATEIGELRKLVSHCQSRVNALLQDSSRQGWIGSDELIR